jgi:hypothetical protein
LGVRRSRGAGFERVLHAFEGFGRALDAAFGGLALLALELGRALDLLLLAVGLDGGVAAAGGDGRGAGASGGEGEVQLAGPVKVALRRLVRTASIQVPSKRPYCLPLARLGEVSAWVVGGDWLVVPWRSGA